MEFYNRFMVYRGLTLKSLQMLWRHILSPLSLVQNVKFFIYFTIIFFKPHQRICLLILEREEGGRKRERERERKQETSLWERNIDRLPLVSSPTRDPTQNLVCALTGNWTQPFSVGAMLQPAEAPGLGSSLFLLIWSDFSCLKKIIFLNRRIASSNYCFVVHLNKLECKGYTLCSQSWTPRYSFNLHLWHSSSATTDQFNGILSKVAA